MMLIIILLAGYAFTGSHAQDWNCLGPQPALTGACVVKVPGHPYEWR